MQRFDDAGGGGALVVNMFGGPGCGKSTMAARLFSELKLRGVESACPEEYAKLAIWSGRPWLLDHQIIIVGKIWETLINLRDKVDVIVVDSPLLLCSVYAGAREPGPFHELVADMHRRTNRVNLLVRRDCRAAYDPSNRREGEQEAVGIDSLVERLLSGMGEACQEISPLTDVGELAERIIMARQREVWAPRGLAA